MKDGCGILCFQPKWLQQFANSKSFLIVYGLLGTIQAMGYMYFVVTLTTIEKRFKIPSQTTGIILSGNEISQILLSLILSYAGGQRNRPQWIAWGVVFCSISCFILAAPHFLFGAGEDSLQLTKEYVDEHMNTSATFLEAISFKTKRNSKLCTSSVSEAEQCNEVFSYLPLILIFLSQFVLGIGNTLYYSLGQAYLDDNTRQKNTPLMLAYALSLRMFGPVIGFVLGYYTLNIYIDPSRTPLIDKSDPRWLGAWWLGWVVLGSLMMLFAILIGLFPKQMPKKQKLEIDAVEYERGPVKSKSIEGLNEEVCKCNDDATLKNFPKALMRLLKNKLLMFNHLSSVFYILGSNGYMTFLARYMEVQFNKSSSDSTIVTGPITIFGMVLGFLLSGFVISKYKPPPRILFFWNVIVGVGYMVGQFSYMHLACESGHALELNGMLPISSDCNSHCLCSGVAYNPVCHTQSKQIFFSPCHAGCTEYDEKKKIYSGCSCSAENSTSYRDLFLKATTLPATRDEENKTQMIANQILFESNFNLPSTTEKTLKFHPINPSDDHLTTLYDVYDDIDVNRFTQKEEKSSTIDFVTNPNEDYYPSYDDTQEQFLKARDDGADKSRRERDASISDENTMIPGACVGNCRYAFYTFTFISLFINLLGSTGRIGNILLNFRAVADKDKAFSQGLALTLISLLALIPGPILFGRIIDSTCLIWSEKCGERGNCQLYDQALFRYYMNLTAFLLTTVGVFFDVLVWYYGKNLKLYGDENCETDVRIQKMDQQESKPLKE